MTSTVRRIGAFEAKTHLSRILDDAEAGIVTLVTRRGKPIALIAPADTPLGRREAHQTDPLGALREIRKKSRPGRETLSSLVSAGRR